MFPKKKIFFSSLFLFAVSSFLHFAYELSGENMFVGLISPVNESIWEHLKLAYYPLLVWWFLVLKNLSIPYFNKVLFSCTSIILAPLLVIFFYYAYTGAFGIESLYIDIFILFAAILISLLIGNKLLCKSAPPFSLVLTLMFAVSLLLLMFVVFTFSPPNFPIFIEP